MPRHFLAAMLLVSMAWTAAASAQSLDVWAVSATRKVAPDDPVESSNRIWSSSLGRVTLSAAKGETEGFHLVVRAASSGLTGLDVRITDLTHEGGGTIARESVSLFAEAWFDISEISNLEGQAPLGTSGPKPDALIPFVDPYGSGREIGTPFAVPAGKNQPIWVSIDVAATTSPGVYEGTLEVIRRSDGTVLKSIAIHLLVRSFSLPATPSLQTLVNVDRSALGFLHGSSGAASQALIDRTFRELTRRRLAPGYSYPDVPSYDNDTGFDWPAAEATWRKWLDENRAPVVSLPWIFDGERGEYRIQRSNGSPYTVADFTPGSHFDVQARLFYSRLHDDLAARGWLGKAVIYAEDDDRGKVSDEPYTEGEETYDRIRSWADIVHRPDSSNPEKRHRLLVAGDSIIPSAPWADLRGVCDVWDHYADELDLNAAFYRERLSSNPDEEVWVVPNGYIDFIDYPAIYPRVVGWFAYKVGATGIEQWDAIAWYDAEQSVVDPWRPGNLTPVWGWGAGALFWPGHNIENRGIDVDGPLPSLRLELAHNGLEDYEYLTLLEGLGLGDLAGSLAANVLPGRLYPGLDVDRDRVDRVRDAAAAVIERGGAVTGSIEGSVRDAQGSPIEGAVVSDGIAAGISGKDGEYRLTTLAETRTLDVSAAGYRASARVVTVRASATLASDFALDALAADIASLFGSFESSADLWEGDGVTVTRTTQHATDGASAMQAVFVDSAEEPVLFTESISPSNWSGFDTLRFDVWNDSEWLTEIHVYVYDEKGANTYEIFYLAPGKSREAMLPLAGTSLDVANIAVIEIYLGTSGRGTRTLVFDDFRLVTVTGRDDSAPGAPVGLTATNTADRGAPVVRLAWSAPPLDASGSALSGLVAYRIERRGPSESSYRILNPFQVVTDPEYRDREVVSSASYSYIVRAIDGSGNVGPASGEATIVAGSKQRRRPVRRN